MWYMLQPTIRAACRRIGMRGQGRGGAASGGCLATQEMLQRAVQDALPSAALQGGARYALFLAGEHGVTAQADMHAGARSH